jgi:hypothetical protein
MPLGKSEYITVGLQSPAIIKRVGSEVNNAHHAWIFQRYDLSPNFDTPFSIKGFMN